MKSAERILRYPKSWFEKYKKYFPVVSFFGGFLWDSATLRRIDQWLDNIILLLYLLLLGFFIVVVNLVEHKQLQKPFWMKYQEWYPEIIQFLLGSLFSAYVVFYFKSASMTKTAVFFLLLVVLLIANEFLKDRLTNIYLQLVLFSFCAFSFFTFFLPILFHKMNVWLFLMGGMASLFLTVVLVFVLYKSKGIPNVMILRNAGKWTGAMFLFLNLAYFFNWIPPVPLSLKYAGIFHHVRHVGDQYWLTYCKPEWYEIWKSSDQPFRYVPGDTAYCFASIFAPTKLQKRVYQKWLFYNEKAGFYETRSRTGYDLYGGRDAGYRGYTYKRSLEPGQWRIDLETEDERLLGRLKFTIVAAQDTLQPDWLTEAR
jgi:hypothetical protein